MGFCQRCGEITGSAGRCKCGGTSRASSTQALFGPSASDRWQQRYVARASNVAGAQAKDEELSEPSPTLRSGGPASTAPKPGSLLPPAGSVASSPTKLAQDFLSAGDGELSSVFGSVLSPKDHWQCAACTVKFRQEEVIYPHPDAKHDQALAEVFFCRQCFAERFRKGNCKKCKYAVLSDAPFVKHGSEVWHQECFVCSYCVDPATEPVIDFAGHPSCEACFDAEAYKTRGIPPSPHLGQSDFLAPAPTLPAPSRWGRPSIAGASSASAARSSPWSRSSVAAPTIAAPTSPTRARGGLESLRSARDSSAIAPSLDELGEKLSGVGLQSPSRRDLKTEELPSSPSRLGRRSLPATPQQADGLRSPAPGTPTQHNTPPVGLATSVSKDKPISASSSPSGDGCLVCKCPVGDGDFVELASTSSRIHAACFRCGGCGIQLGSGRFIEVEGLWWHHKCAPAPKRYRSIVTSLQEISDDEGSRAQDPPNDPVRGSSGVPSLREEDESTACVACARSLGYGKSVTVPRARQSYHETCFCCAGCGAPLAGASGVKGFIQRDGRPCHEMCAPPEIASSPERPSATSPPPSLPSSRSLRNLSTSSPLPPKFTLPASPTKSVEPSLFARRPRPPANFGGLLICAGCSVRATEKETVAGPRGRRYHAKCLKCRDCSRALDSECRVGEDGVLRCEACRKAASRKPLVGNVNPSRVLSSR